MFKNIFNKKPNVAKQQALIAQIHNEIDTAQDRLIDEANKILSEKQLEAVQSVEEKAKRLKALGFIKASDVAIANQIQVKRKEDEIIITKTKEEAETIKYYQQHYPTLKFITESEMERICAKYGLIFAPVANYIADVPDKNLKEIESAPRIKAEEEPFSICRYKITSDRHVSDNCPKDVRRQLFEGFMRRDTGEIRASDIKEHFKLKENVTYTWPDQTRERIRKDGLFIAAPYSHFDGLKDLSKKTKHGFFNTETFVKEDPIVFRYVKGGIQIITKWGLEGEDSSLANEKMN